MPIGYAFPVVLMAVATLLSLAPARRPRLLAMLSFRVGLLFDELPQLAFGILLIITILTIAGGDIQSTAGWVVVGVAAVAMFGQVLLFRRGLRTSAVVRRALTEAGIDSRPRRRWPWARILLAPYWRRRRDVERIANVSYGPAGRRHRLDVYLHRSRPADAPVLVHLHGGGYVSGHKNSQSLPLIYRLASQGWVCISANYRLRPSAGFLDHLSDAKRVIAWAHQHGAEYGADPARLVVSGSSAGAHLTALCALTQNDARFQPGFEDADTSLTAAVCLNGYFGHYYQAQDMSSAPSAYVRPDAPPFLIAHGDLDTYTPVTQARDFAKQLREASKNIILYLELSGGQHAFDLFHSPRFEAIIDAIEEFAISVWPARTSPFGRV